VSRVTYRMAVKALLVVQTVRNRKAPARTLPPRRLSLAFSQPHAVPAGTGMTISEFGPHLNNAPRRHMGPALTEGRPVSYLGGVRTFCARLLYYSEKGR
jgi:hypothetical protein